MSFCSFHSDAAVQWIPHEMSLFLVEIFTLFYSLLLFDKSVERAVECTVSLYWNSQLLEILRKWKRALPTRNLSSITSFFLSRFLLIPVSQTRPRKEACGKMRSRNPESEFNTAHDRPTGPDGDTQPSGQFMSTPRVH